MALVPDFYKDPNKPNALGVQEGYKTPEVSPNVKEALKGISFAPKDVVGQIGTTNTGLGGLTDIPQTPPKPKTTTAVVSPNAAITEANKAQDLVTYNGNTKAQADALDASALSTDKFLKGSGKPNPNYIAPKENTPTVPETPKNNETENAVLHPGQTQYYNKMNGQQEWITTPTDSSVPAGYSKVPPQNNPTSDEFTSEDGYDYKQFADGTYGKYNPATGTFQAINAGAYNSQKQISKDTQALNDLKNNGTLTPSQQAQIDAITAQYKELIDRQGIVNANAEGATTIAENLYGMGNTLAGKGEITQVINDGISKISALQAAEQSAISKMKTAFLTDDMEAVKQSWDIYNNSQASTQKALDALQNATIRAQEKLDASNSSINVSMAKKYSDTTDPILPDDTAAQRLAKLQTSPRWGNDQTVAQSLNKDESDFMAQMATSGVPLSSMFPNFGIGKDAANTKIAIVKSMIANARKLGIDGQELANSMLDRQAKAKTYTKLQTQGSLLAAQELKVESDFDLVKSLGSKVGDASLQGAAPILQNWINTGTLATTNNPALNNWLGALTTSMTNYARVVYGQTGAAGVAQGANTEVQNLIKKGLSVATVNSYIDNVAKPEMKNTLGGFDTSLKDLMGDMNQADGTLAPQGGLGIGPTSKSGAGSGSTGTYDPSQPLSWDNFPG